MVQQTLGDIFKNYASSAGPIFTNKDVLSHTYVPGTTYHRDEQIKQLAAILSPAARNQNTSNCFLYGKTGTGKTMVTMHVARELENANRNIRILYINCKLRGVTDTEYRLLAELSRILGSPVPPTGLPTDEVYNIFLQALAKSGKNAVLILDEIDSLVAKIGDGILYNLTRLDHNQPNTKLTIVGISNSLSLIDTIDPRVKSSLSEEEIIFPPYNSKQLADILEQRAKPAFRPGILENGVIQKCAALAAQEHGDARKALDLLRIAAELAERDGMGGVSISHVDAAEDKLDTDRVVMVVQAQPKQSLAVLAAIIRLIDSGQKDIQTGDIFTLYEKICADAGLKALTQRRISDLIAELDMLGIINTSVVSRGRYGRTREIRIPLGDSVLGKIKDILRENYVL